MGTTITTGAVPEQPASPLSYNLAMAQITIEDRFHGTCNLIILHLRRAAKSNDIEIGFETARNMRMLDSEQEGFVRSCLSDDERIQNEGKPVEPVTEDRIRELQRCVLRLNTADPA